MTATTQRTEESVRAAGAVYAAPLLYALVFFGGFANLAAEIIGPRLFASLFGNTNVVWAVMISVTLVGLSVGYAAGGRLSAQRARELLPGLLIVNALWLVGISWAVWELPAGIAAAGAGIDLSVFLVTALVAFFVPSLLFGMLSPMAITLLNEGRPPEAFSATAGNVFAVSTVGSVLGALAAAFFLIPWVGLSASLVIFAVGLCLFAVYFALRPQKLTAAGAAVICILLPQPGYQWVNDDGLTLLAQRDGYYQTIRVYGNDEFVQMFLGPTFHSKMDLATGEPLFNYARRMVELAEESGDLSGKRALVIGGAGHAMARALVARGATVTEVEIDPLVVALSDTYFGPVDAEVVVQDGRVFVEQAEAGAYDLILVDAFDGAATVPPQITTREFFEAVDRALAPGGLMLYNFVGTPEGPRSGAYHAVSATMREVFDAIGATGSTQTAIEGERSQNILFAAGQSLPPALDLVTVPEQGHLLTDDRNPIDLLLAGARDFVYFRR